MPVCLLCFKRLISMKRFLKNNLFLMTILFTSCHNSEKFENASLFSFEDFIITTKLHATTIEFEEIIMRPLFFIKSDSLLIVQNIRSNNMLYVFNINSRKKVGEFISFGSGPNDLLTIKNIQLAGSDLYITDNQKKTINNYNIADFHSLTSGMNPIKKVMIDDYFTNLAYLKDGYVATAINADNRRLTFYNSKGEKAFSAGEYPNFGKELTIFEKTESFTSAMTVCPKYERIYLFGMNTDLIEIYDFQGILIKRIHGPEQIFPHVREIATEDGFVRVSPQNPKYAFFSPVVLDDEVYVSYSGNHKTQYEEVPTIQQIFVFDLDCNPLRRYELSKPIISFTVDPETKNIFATSNVPDYHFIVFEQ